MASIISSPLTTTTTTTVLKDQNSRLVPKTSQGSLLVNRPIRHIARKISCNANNNDHPNNNNDPRTISSSKVDRRNVLLGLGGLYGAATSLGLSPSSLAEPALPDLKAACKLTDATDLKNTPEGLNCCPFPIDPLKVVDFDPRNYPTPTLKVRPAAHTVDAKYIKKYQRAIQLMKDLKADDPRNFFEQAKVHCTYCNGGYSQLNHNDELLQVHFSWLFFPFHRAYLFFFERILGKLIGDPTFAMPYWNWDHPDGMQLPAMYTTGGLGNSLFDLNRDKRHLPPTLVDLAYGNSNVLPNIGASVSDKDRIANNLNIMNKQVVGYIGKPESFLGGKYVAGPKKPGEESFDISGSIEFLPHNNIHEWVGDPTKKFNLDMGTFFSAGRDPVFYAHHANVDRMWTIWQGLGGRDFDDADWLNTSFVFYDENAKPVRIYVRDVLNDEKMGFSYQKMPLPWVEQPAEQVVPQAPRPVAETLKFPRSLGEEGFRTKVARPTKSRSKQEKSEKLEVLEVKVGLGETDDFVKFDVYVNDPDDHKSDRVTKATSYFAGSFSAIPLGPSRKGHSHNKKIKQKLSLNKLLESIGADNDDTVDVLLVPQSGQNAVTILDIKIKYL